MELKEALEYAVALSGSGTAVRTDDGGQIILVPNGMKVEKLPPLEPLLPRIKQNVTLFDAPSFISYVNHYKSDATRIFAVPGFLAADKVASILAVFDYHSNEPGYLVHRALYSPRYSSEWRTWSDLQRKLTQVQFAEFIEENRKDVREPEAAQLLDLIRTFKATRKIEFDSVVYQPNGDVTLGYSETTQASGARGNSTVMPEKLTVGIPVFFRAKLPHAVDIFVRYRVENGGVHFALKPDRLDVIENDAFSKLCEEIAKAIGIEPYLGTTA